jgi:hypothetical protein
MFPSFDFFRQVFTQITDDFGTMVIVNRGARGSILDKVFYYKADNEDIGTIGCKQFKEFHDKNYNSNWKQSNESFDINKFVVKKNKQNIVVNKIGSDGGNEHK